MINPTGGNIRDDPAGSGRYGAPRGARRHRGLDLIARPGQPVKAPVDGLLVRQARPYADDRELSGVVLRGRRVTLKLFYLHPDLGLVGKHVRAGDIIGTAQDVTRRYPGSGMLPHIHMEVILCDPLYFLSLP